MIFYIISYGIFFAVEKIRSKIISFYIHKSLKRITYKNHYADSFLDWIFIT